MSAIFRHALFLCSAVLLAITWQVSAFAASTVTFESGQVRPLALSPDGKRLFAVNTPDNRLEVFDVKADGLTLAASVAVGMEPVAIAARNNNEVWVVNHLSDSISIVDMGSTPPRVVRTLLVGDEPRDIVFAGAGRNFAYITAAHRGQNSPYIDPLNPGELTTPGKGRADVWVFNANSLGTSLGGTPLTILTLFTDTPRGLAVTPDGNTVYAAGFETGNRTTAINEGSVCDGGATAAPCNPAGGPQAPGGLPAPNQSTAGVQQPEVGLIVKYNGTNWVDELGRSWNNQVRFSLPDLDVFAINAAAPVPTVISSIPGVGTVLFNMVVNPANGKLYVSNTEARNEVRFEGSRPPGSTISTVQGRLHLARISVINGGSVTPRHLNKHIDYAVRPAPPGVLEKSLATPTAMAVTGNGATLYLAAFGSGKIGIFNTTELENDSFVPDAVNHIALSGGGPSGLALDEARGQLYVLTRFDNTVSIISTASKLETRRYSLNNPEPQSVKAGRPFLYDARLTSSNGEASCSSCHVFGDLDSLAWDLGDPTAAVLSNPNPSGPIPGSASFHPMKGPMTTQSLRGMANMGPMHWRGDRTAGHSGGDPLDEAGAFMEFNVAFPGLLGRDSTLSTTEMQAFTDFVLSIVYPPNPIRALDNSLTASQSAGRSFFMNTVSTALFLTCNNCHVLNPANGFFGTSGLMSFEGETQVFKIPHLRNMYQKVGMFGMPLNTGLFPGSTTFFGDQVRGYGFVHDGAADTLLRFHSAPLFTGFSGGDPQRRQVEQFMFAFDTNLAPIVGQQITIDIGNPATVNPRIDLMLARAAAGECDVIVKGTVGGVAKGWFVPLAGNVISDKVGDPAMSESQLRALAATPGQALTYTAVPKGSGMRSAVDRDEDGVLDGNDVCPALADPGQADGDGDGVGDACDNCTLVANANQRDSNGDGYGNLCDGDFNNDGNTNTLDLNILKAAYRTAAGDPNYNVDVDLNGDGPINTLDLNIFKAIYRRPPGPSALATP